MHKLFLNLMLLMVVSCSELSHYKAGTELPREIYKKHTAAKMATILVENLHKNRERHKAGGYDYATNSKIILAFPEKVIELIIKSGCFLNRHQVYYDKKGDYNLEERVKLEDLFIGYRLGSIKNDEVDRVINEIRPKYAFLIPHRTYHYSKSYIDNQYGNVFAIINDSLKSRSTFSLGDSSDMKKKSAIHTFKYTGKVNHTYKNNNKYWEAQIWGPLCLEHIDAFLINCPQFKRISENSFKILKKSKRPIHQCRLSESFDSVEMGKRLHSY